VLSICLHYVLNKFIFWFYWKACDRRTKIGCRNYAILLLLVRLGLRASEVINLSLDDINWDQGELDICGKGRKHRVLPLPDDVGHALASYLRYARPKSIDRQVFIRSRAPYRGLHNPSNISSIVRRTLNAAGLNPQHMGPIFFVTQPQWKP